MNTEPSLQVIGSKRQTVEWTVRQYAQREQVSVVTVRRWVQKGALEIRRTVGGGIRIIEKNQ